MSANNDIYSVLVTDGWREIPDPFKPGARAFFKRFGTPTKCACNDSKSGIQVGLYVYEHKGIPSYCMDIHGELSDGTWVNLENYSMPPEIEKGLAAIPRLLATWEAAASFKVS